MNTYVKKSPTFEAGVFEEPHLLFGGRHEHVDPKNGLALYGPYSLADQDYPALTSIILGIIGPPNMVADARQFLNSFGRIVTNDGSSPFSNPHFPGFNKEHPFQCELKFGEAWEYILKQRDIDNSLKYINFNERVYHIVELYIKGVQTLYEIDPCPNVILCCIPQDVIGLCTVRKTTAGKLKRRRYSDGERRLLREIKSGQTFLFPQIGIDLGIEGGEPGYNNLRRALKAESMRFGLPTQLIWPRTLQLVSSNNTKYTTEDIATRMWNFSAAIYYKAGGTPWRLANVNPNTCFVGISFYREKSETKTCLCTSMAQTFTASGDAYVLRGRTFEWDETKGRSPHLDKAGAADIMRSILELYQRHNRGSLPHKIVVHKSSKFWDDELQGFEDASGIVPMKSFVAFGSRGIRFYRPGMYPPLRGTYIKFNEDNLLLYTTGYVPFLRTYKGSHIPQPLEILEHYGDSPWEAVLRETLALTKMNWNTTYFTCVKPITLNFSQRIGRILAEMSAEIKPRAEYRFYM